MAHFSMSQGETVTLRFTFPDGEDLSPFETFRWYAWQSLDAAPWGVSGTDGDGTFSISGQVLTVTIPASASEGLSLTDLVTGFHWDLRLIDLPRKVIAKRGALEMYASPSLDSG